MKGIALIGFMGSGKSTIGPILAQKLGLDFVDLDAIITSAAGATVSEVFAEEGESGWRRWETRALRNVAKQKHVVLACGGGVVLKTESVRLLRDSFLTLYLKTPKEDLLDRLSRGAATRPLLEVDNPREVISRLYDKRSPIYEAVADITILTDGKTPQEVAEAAIVVLKEHG